MAKINLTEFKSALEDVVRPNRFWVTVGAVPGGVGLSWDDKYSFRAQAASLPGRTLGDINVNWQGMTLKLAGDPTFEDFTLKVLNDKGFQLRTFFEDWANLIAEATSTVDDVNNVRTSFSDYKTTVIVSQLGNDGTVLAEYTLEGAYPSNIGAITLDMGNQDSVEDFEVTFKYDYWKKTNTAGGTI